MELFSIQGYSYSREAVDEYQGSKTLRLEADDYQPLTLREYFRMRKSLSLMARFTKAQSATGSGAAIPAGISPAAHAKAASSLGAGQRWITMHPNGRDEKGVPVIIQEDSGGKAHVVGGAHGALNMLKLDNIKSKEDYEATTRARRMQEQSEREVERADKKKVEVGLTPAERKVLRENEKARREAAKSKEAVIKTQKNETKNSFAKRMASLLGWADRTDEIAARYQEGRAVAERELQAATKGKDKGEIKAAEKNLKNIDKGYEKALKAQQSNMVAAGRGAVRAIHEESVADEAVRSLIEAKLGDRTQADEVIRTTNSNNGKGFQTEYGNLAKNGGLTDEALAAEKKELFDASMEKIALSNPTLANMVKKGIETKKIQGEIRREFYERDRLANKVTDIDNKVEVLKAYYEYKSEMAKIENANEATPEKSGVDMSWGDGLCLDREVAPVESFMNDVAREAERLEGERQAEVNGSLLDKIKANPDGSSKWIANGNYDGLNLASLSILKDSMISRDVVDVLGVRAGAQLLSKVMHDSMSPEDFGDAVEGIKAYHSETSEELVRQAVDTSAELLSKAEEVRADIDKLKAENPDDLTVLNELNEARRNYLDESNRILGQTLGRLESTAMLGQVAQGGATLDKIESNLGAISSGDAVTRLRALGLDKGDYSIETVNGDRIATISKTGIDKLVHAVDPEEINLDQEIDDIKRGVYDEDGWLPAGLACRPVESYEDPGENAALPSGDIDNQSIADDAEGMKAAQEAAHRSLGEIPEGAFAFSKVDELSPAQQTDLRRYWENNIYKGSTADRQSVRGFQGEKGKTHAGAWKSFISQNGGDEAGAYEAIKDDMTQRTTEDMWGNKDTPPICLVKPDDVDSYLDKDGHARVKGAAQLFDDIKTLQEDSAAGRITESSERVAQEIERKKSELPGKLKALYGAELQGHYHKWMSGISEDEYAAGESAERHEDSPWAEYVRMHGDTGRAQAAVMDSIKGNFLSKFSDNYRRVAKKALAVKQSDIAEAGAHRLGMLGKTERDSIINKVQAELASAGATVANRSGGKFAAGSWREKAIEYMAKERAAQSAQGSMFDDAELEQDDGTKRLSIGARAESQLASMLPELAQNQLRGQKFAVSTMQASGERQRAIKMFERTKRMNLTFGTGKGKTIMSIGSFTDLNAQGKAKRAIFAVPSVVQMQFGGEVNVFCTPGKYKVSSDPALSRDERISAMRDTSGNHMCVMTHQSLRDDLVYLMSKRMDKSEDETKASFEAMSPKDRASYLGETLKDEGITFDMLTVDEAHYTSNRKGKDDSSLANVIDALNANTPYFMNQTATPVKNDISEAFDMLHKVAPDKFSDRNGFIKRYGVDSDFDKESLQRLVGRYCYASPTETGIKKNRTKESINLSDDQKQAYAEVEAAFRRCSRANRAGTVDVDAVRVLSPHSFDGKPESDYESIAKRVQQAAGTIKEEALNRVVNTFDGDNAKMNKLGEIIESKCYAEANEKNNAKAGDRAPGVVFAHNLASVEAIRVAMAKKGLRVGVITGTMSGAEKEKIKVGFHPSRPEDRKYDLVVLSDAGATGLNLQNAKYLVNYDLPQTAWVKEQREGRIDRFGQAHDEIDYHDLVTNTGHEAEKWDRIQRKARLGAIFETDPGSLEDSGIAARVASARQERINNGTEEEKGAA
jgi:hypothetical protein